MGAVDTRGTGYHAHLCRGKAQFVSINMRQKGQAEGIQGKVKVVPRQCMVGKRLVLTNEECKTGVGAVRAREKRAAQQIENPSDLNSE